MTHRGQVQPSISGTLVAVLETSARLLRLLSLLQARRDWPGPALAERLGVDVRTVRRDVDRLRQLGYPVHSVPGPAGGYRLGAGADVPPLLLDDEEAVAVAVALRTAGAGVAGIEESAARALAKLEQVLPPRLSAQLHAVQAATERVAPDRRGPTVEAEVVVRLAAACRDQVRLRFDYLAHDGSASSRLVEPHRLVTWGARWYLLAWDLERADWRTFRLDRIAVRTTGDPFTPRPLPGGDATAYVARGASAAAWRWRARVVVDAPAEAVVERVNPAVGVVTPLGPSSCELATGAASLDDLAVHLGMLGAGFHVSEPPELVAHLRALAARYAAATPG
jgi:predicted DNA-binding transcriptional regulator YafY